MKKITLTLALVLMAFFASAQIYKLENSTFSVSRNSGNQGGYLAIWRTEVCDITQSLTMESTSINISLFEAATIRAKIKQRNVACENLMPGNIPTSDICDEQPFIPFPDNSDDKEEAE